MLNSDITTSAAPAMLTEKQLFNQFADGEAIVLGRTGKVKHRIPVIELFGGIGETDDFTEVMPCALDNLRDSDAPAFELQMLLETLQGMVADVTLARNGFDRCLAEAEAATGEVV